MNFSLSNWENNAFPEPNSGCHIWMRGLDGKGYGVWKRYGENRANRIAWKLFRGPIPLGLFVLHHCDNRACVNPDHLFLGTQTDNVADMERKNRQSRMGRAKLSADDVNAILADERPYRDIAKEFGIHETAISRLKRGHSYKHVKSPHERTTIDARSIRWHR